MVADAKGVLNTLRSQEIHHTKREVNFVAHGLAKAVVGQILRVSAMMLYF
jgi:hypothetical protein